MITPFVLRHVAGSVLVTGAAGCHSTANLQAKYRRGLAREPGAAMEYVGHNKQGSSRWQPGQSGNPAGAARGLTEPAFGKRGAYRRPAPNGQ
jgi:hypothetical protein